MRWPWITTTGLLIGTMAYHVTHDPINGVTILGAAALAISVYKMRRAS